MKAPLPRHARRALVPLALIGAAALAFPALRYEPTSLDTIHFGRDVLPILSDKCFACHGPDAAARETNLRFDRREGAFADLGGYFAIVPGDSSNSELYRRITDAGDPMPPRDSGKQLSAGEMDMLRRWIDAGAPWSEHWAYEAPVPQPIPVVRDGAWPRGPLDRFVLARLEAAGRAPALEAPRTALIRRASLDITGLPPTLAEIDDFLGDQRSDAFEQVIDRLLASPRYGEHMARAWLDAARYGDTHGLALDNERGIWPYRDWVIRSFNNNQPFDEFTRDQLAGDLIPGATIEQRVATGFNRCNPTTSETGVIDEEYLVKYTVDRVQTVATTWLGMTMACAQCHDHKFDPVSQKEYYEFFAFFGNLVGQGKDGNAPYPAPSLALPSQEQIDARAVLTHALDELASEPHAVEDSVEWVEFGAANAANGELAESVDAHAIEFRGRIANPGQEPVTALRLEISPIAEGAPEANDFLITNVALAARGPKEGSEFTDIALIDARADDTRAKFEVRNTIDESPATGWTVNDAAQPHTLVLLLSSPLARAGNTELRVRIQAANARQRIRLWTSTDIELAPVAMTPWWTVGPLPPGTERPSAPDADPPATFHGSPWRERTAWTDAKFHKLQQPNAVSYFYRTIEGGDARTEGRRPLRLTLGTFRLRVPPTESSDSLSIWLNGEQVLEHRVSRAVPLDERALEWNLLPGKNHVLVRATHDFGGFTFSLREDPRTAGGRMVGPVSLQRSALQSERRSDLQYQLRELEAVIPRTLVTSERDSVATSHVLLRGRYDLKGDEVAPGTPAILPPLPQAAEARRANRLDLAHWLIDPSHPLTARVAVNRIWQEVFGTGIVRTTEDFGVQGERPSHPALLDWLALDFVEHGWNVKRLMRQLVTSATYRQSSTASYAERSADPSNRLLGRTHRHRLDAERIRDSALAISGLLVDKVGGPSVRPYQPSGLWKPLAYTGSNTGEFERDRGDALYRRSLYTFWKRTSPPPGMQLFDAPTREACHMRRARTNTPLQALALMNDEAFVEAARAFAERILHADEPSDTARLTFAVRSATARRPDDEETAILRSVLADALEFYAANPEAAEQLLAVGEHEYDESVDAAQLAAWTVVANLILNLDEVITHG